MPAPQAVFLSRIILGMRVDMMPPTDMIDRVTALSRAGQGGYCCVTNVHQCVLAHDDSDFMAIVNGADLVIPDSTILLKAIALRHRLAPPETIRGADMMLALCARAERESLTIGLLGGRDDAALGVLQATLLGRFPRLAIGFAASPPFRPVTTEENESTVADITAARVDLLFVGLGCPKQERWMAGNRASVPAMMIGVGAAFDFVAGIVPPSPGWVHRAGLEWFYRLVREPRRLARRYLTTSPRFVTLLVAEALSSRFRGGR